MAKPELTVRKSQVKGWFFAHHAESGQGNLDRTKKAALLGLKMKLGHKREQAKRLSEYRSRRSK